MRARTLLALAGLGLLMVQASGAAHADGPELLAATQAISGALSEHSQARLQAGERVRVIVMMRDAPSQRAMRGLADVRGSAALAQFEDRRAAVLRETLGAGLMREEGMPTQGAAIYADFPISGGFALTANAQEISALSAHPDVAAVYEDAPILISPVETTPSPLVAQSDAEAADFPPNLSSLFLNRMRADGYDGAGQTIAILDSGIEYEHASFADKVIAGACFSRKDDAQGLESLCPDSVERVTSLTDPEPGDSCVEAAIDSENGAPICYHGSHVGGIAAGLEYSISPGLPALGGVAPRADLVAVNVMSRASGDSCDSSQGNQSEFCIYTYPSAYVEALEWLYENRDALRLSVVNMSFGGGAYRQSCGDDPAEPIIALLREAGIPSVIAAGNDEEMGAIASPACAPSAVSVASTGNNSSNPEGYASVSSFSNASAFTDIAAPGENILAPWQSLPREGDSRCPGYAHYQMSAPGWCHYFSYESGTSMAAPQAAGAMALLRQAFPHASVDDLVAALRFGSLSAEQFGSARFVPAINLDEAYAYLLRQGRLPSGVSLSPAEAYRAVNRSVNVSSFDTQTYTLDNPTSVPVSVVVTDLPEWLQVSPTEVVIPAGGNAQLQFSVADRLYAMPRHWMQYQATVAVGSAALARIELNGEAVNIPVSLSTLSEIHVPGQFGPFDRIADQASGVNSIFRVVGLNSGLPERIQLSYALMGRDSSESDFHHCDISINPQRYSGGEYLITASDMAGCDGLDRVSAYLRIDPADAADLEGMRARRFLLNSALRLSDSSFDPNQVNLAAITDLWGNSEGAGASQNQAALDGGVGDGPGLRAWNSVAEPTAVGARYQAVSTRIDWLGDAADLMASELHITGFNGHPFHSLQLRVWNPSQEPETWTGTYEYDAYTCVIEADPDRITYDSYVIYPEEYSACGRFGRSDVVVNVYYTNTGELPSPSVAIQRRLVHGGGLSGFAGDLMRPFSVVRSNDLGERYFDSPVFEWTGDRNAPTQSVFRISPVKSPFDRIEVAIQNAAAGDFVGELTDCTLAYNPDNQSLSDYVFTSADLAECGDFGRGDVQFRLVYDSETDIASRAFFLRIAIGAHGDITDFGFDSVVDTPLASNRIASGQDEVITPVFEWVGDRDAGTKAAFRITGLDGGAPDSISVAISNPTNNASSYSDDFDDCELDIQDLRIEAHGYVIGADDLGACGAFGRADVRFRIRTPRGGMSDGIRIRRFSVTTAGGLTDFGFDTERDKLPVRYF